MAFGKSTLAESKRASSCCMKAGIVVFVGLCLVGTWMLTSSNISSEDLSYIIPKPVVNDRASTPSLDSSGTEDTVSEHSEPTEDTVERESDTKAEKNTEKFADRNKENRPSKRNKDTTVASNDASETDAPTADNGGETFEEMVLENEDKKPHKEKFDGVGTQETVESFLTGDQSEILSETSSHNGTWSTQAAESNNEVVVQASSSEGQITGHNWKLCNVTARADYIPCLDNVAAIKRLRSTKHYEHRERHCPEQAPTCLVPLPDGYKQPIKWPESRNRIWYNNVPHTKLVAYKGHQNWVNITGEHISFPGGGTQFKHGALHYIDFIQEVQY